MDWLVLLYGTIVHPLSDQPAPSTAAPAAIPHTPAPVQRYIDYLKDRYINKSPILKEKVLKVRPKEFIHLNLISNAAQYETKQQFTNHHYSTGIDHLKTIGSREVSIASGGHGSYCPVQTGTVVERGFNWCVHKTWGDVVELRTEYHKIVQYTCCFSPCWWSTWSSLTAQ